MGSNEIIQEFQNTQRDEQQIKNLTSICINPKSKQQKIIKITIHKSKDNEKREEKIRQKKCLTN